MVLPTLNIAKYKYNQLQSDLEIVPSLTWKLSPTRLGLDSNLTWAWPVGQLSLPDLMWTYVNST